MNRNIWKIATIVALATFTLTLYGGQTPPPQAPEAQNLKVLPKDIPRQRLLAAMNGFTRALGVKCDHCHIVGEFAKDDKPEKDVARAMIRMVMNLRQNADQFLPGGRVDKLNCWTCHRGSAKIEVPPPPPPAGQGARPPGEQKPPQG